MNIRKFKWILAFAGAVAVVLLLRGFAFTSCLIPSTGMENSIFQGERILVNKWSYGLRVPFMSLFSYHRWCESPVRRQDIIVFNNPAGIRQPVIDRREIYISRCLGVPGDTLLVDSLFSMTKVFCLPLGRRLRAVWLPAVLPAFRQGCSVALGICWNRP